MSTTAARAAWLDEHAPGASPEQRRFILADEPVVAGIAGPGAGKTGSSVWLLNSYLQTGTNPKGVGVVTFTNAGADELKERLGPDVSLYHLGTVHSLALKLLREHGASLGYSRDMTVADQATCEAIMAESALKFGVKDSVKNLMKLRAAGVVEVPQNPLENTLRDYIDTLRANGAVDFGLILEDAVRLAHTAVLESLELLLVDEAQDSDVLDLMLYRRLVAKRLILVLDPDQAIMDFRTPVRADLRQFFADKGAVIYLLEDNYRSAPEICEIGQNLIRHNQDRFEKGVCAKRTDLTADIRVVAARSTRHEAGLISDWVRQALEEGVPAQEICIMARKNAQRIAIREELMAQGLPVEPPAPSPEVDPKVRSALELIRNPTPLYIGRWLDATRGPEKSRQLREKCRREQGRLDSLIPEITAITRGKSEEQIWDNLLNALARLNAQGLLRFTLREAAPIKAAMKSLGGNKDLSMLSLILSKPEEKDGSADGYVQVLTMHGSKGREFQRVWMAGMSESSFDQEKIVDERRLAYVGITRAKQHLVLSYPQTEEFRPQPKMPLKIVPCVPSRFITEAGLALPAEQLVAEAA